MSFISSVGSPPQGGRIRKLFAALFLGLSAGLVLTGAAVAEPVGSYRGEAFGAFANSRAGLLATTLGRSAFQPCPCQGTNGQVRSNRVTSIGAGEDGNLFAAGEMISTGVTDATATSAEIEFVSHVNGLRMFDDMITASAIVGVAHTNVGANTIQHNTNQSRFFNLQIAGRDVGRTVEPNTVMPLPGIGHVTLRRERERGDGAERGSIELDMMVIHVTQRNQFDVPVGSIIVVGHASSGFNRHPSEASLAGAAWGTESNNNVENRTRNQIGRAAFITLGCQGSGGDINRNFAARVRAENILSVGSSETTAFGGPVEGNRIAARTTASTDGVNMLNGLITAGNIRVVAQESVGGISGQHNRSADTSFALLRILGTPIPDPVMPNTQLPIPGVGFVVLNEQEFPPDSRNTTVNGLRLVVTRNNQFDLPVGSNIIVSHAEASVRKVNVMQSAVANR
jgi:hypothetical protein